MTVDTKRLRELEAAASPAPWEVSIAQDGVWPEREVRSDSLPDDVQDALIEAALMLDSERMEERCEQDV